MSAPVLSAPVYMNASTHARCIKQVRLNLQVAGLDKLQLPGVQGPIVAGQPGVVEKRAWVNRIIALSSKNPSGHKDITDDGLLADLRDQMNVKACGIIMQHVDPVDKVRFDEQAESNPITCMRTFEGLFGAKDVNKKEAARNLFHKVTRDSTKTNGKFDSRKFMYEKQRAQQDAIQKGANISDDDVVANIATLDVWGKHLAHARSSLLARLDAGTPTTLEFVANLLLRAEEEEYYFDDNKDPREREEDVPDPEPESVMITLLREQNAQLMKQNAQLQTAMVTSYRGGNGGDGGNGGGDNRRKRHNGNRRNGNGGGGGGDNGDKICYNFKETGRCKFGDKCRYAHAEGGDQ